MVTVDLTEAEAQIVVDALASIGGLGHYREVAHTARLKFLEQGIDYTPIDHPAHPFERPVRLIVKEKA